MSRRLPFIPIALIAAFALIAGCGPDSKPGRNNGRVSAPPSGTAVVTINGQTLTTRQVRAYIRLRTHHAATKLTPEQKRRIVKELVKITLAAQDAKKEGLQNKPAVQAELALRRSQFLSNEAVQHYSETHKPTEAALQREYRKMEKAPPGEQYKVRNIRVKAQDLAKKIIGRLDHGANFSTLAGEYSIDPKSAKKGGELGWFQSDHMAPQFSAAVAKLKPGEYTQAPVKTRAGWNVILLEGKHVPPPPNYTAVKPVLAAHAKRDMTQNYLKQLKSQANIVWGKPGSVRVGKPGGAATAGTAATAAPSTRR